MLMPFTLHAYAVCHILMNVSYYQRKVANNKIILENQHIHRVQADIPGGC